MNWLPLALGAAAVVVLVMMFMQSRDTTGPVSEIHQHLVQRHSPVMHEARRSNGSPADARLRRSSMIPVVSVSLPEVELLIERAVIRLEQYRIALQQTPDDKRTKGTIEGLEDSVATLRGYLGAVRVVEKD